MKLAILSLCALASVAEAFQPTSLPLRTSSLAKASAGASLRHAPRSGASLTKTSMAMPIQVYTVATSLLLAFDPEGSKTDRMYDGVAATGNVEAPVWVLPVAALSIGLILALVIPLALKPGSDAFNEMRNDIGVMSNKDKDYK